MTHPSRLRELIGPLPSEAADKARQRLHQCWWRACVLGAAPGPHPKSAGETICNTIAGGEDSLANLLGQGARDAVERTLAERERQSKAAGMVDRARLFGNLLSSQPLAFNFFGELQRDPALASAALQGLLPGIDRVVDVRFEYAPEGWIDNSAFDVALVVEARGRTGLIGLECKFTEPFSPKVYTSSAYREKAEESGSFRAAYDDCIDTRFNQLFRGQLMAEELVKDGRYDFRMTGLFCHHDDAGAIATGEAFRGMLVDGASFHVITYARFLEALQQLPLSWEHRCWTMTLWARYCALELSEAAWKAARG